MNIFEQASVHRLRFPSNRGELTTEDLWQLPLQSKTQFDLDTVAKAVNASLKAVTEESFVTTTASPVKSRFELMLEILKHIIAVKLAAQEAAKTAAARKAEREKLMGVLEKKQDSALELLTPEQIAARLKELGD